jgi:hypothetical protein
VIINQISTLRDQTVQAKLHYDAFEPNNSFRTFTDSKAVDELLGGFAISGIEPVAAAPVSALRKLIAFAEQASCQKKPNDNCAA